MKVHVWIKTKPPNSGFGQWIATVVSCYFGNGLSLAWTSSAFMKIKKKQVDIVMDHYQMSLVAALSFTGMFVSAIPSSYLMDIVGRKGVLMCGRVFQLTHWLMLYLSRDINYMYTARFMHGLFAGMVLFVMPVYISEITHKFIRGRAQDVMNILLMLGIVFESVVGALSSYEGLIIANGSAELFMFVIMFMIPESPYFFIIKENNENAMEGLQWLRGRDLDVKPEFDKMKENIAEHSLKRVGYAEIFRIKSNRKGFIIAGTLQFLQRFSGMVVIVPYASFIFPKTWWLPEEYGPIALNCTYLVMCVISGYFIDSWGRKILLLISSSGTCVFMLGILIWYYLKERTKQDISGTEWIVVACILLQGFFYSLGYVYIPALMTSELFPMEIKSKASAIVTMIAVGVSSFSLFIFLPLSNNVGIYSNFMIYFVANFLCAMFSLRIIETKDKSLEAIQAELKGRPRPNSEIIYTTHKSGKKH